MPSLESAQRKTGLACTVIIKIKNNNSLSKWAWSFEIRLHDEQLKEKYFSGFLTGEEYYFPVRACVCERERVRERERERERSPNLLRAWE